MSKLSFRARQLDSNKPLPVYGFEELPDLTELSTINRAVPQMPTGMEKEEETEHHLQRAISAQQVYGDKQQLVIPTPETKPVDADTSLIDDSADDFKMPKQYIHIQALGVEDERPEYDMDDEDLEWLTNFNKDKEKVSNEKFEHLIDKLEKGSGSEVLSLTAAKALIKDEEYLEPVYNYWVKKHSRSCMNGLILTLKSEKKDASSPNDPYIAFRRRIEKMQTRKNRKNEELSYEKMLKLRRDLNTACTILDMVKRREQRKKDVLQITVDVFDFRYKSGDFTGQLLTQCLELLKIQETNNVPLYGGATTATGNRITPGSETHDKDERTEDVKYRRGDILAEFKRKQRLTPQNIGSPYNQPDLPSEPDDDVDELDGVYAFKRRRGCRYLAPRLEGDWPWECPGHPRYRYSLTSLSRPSRLLGYARRRVGRGGRVLIDRASSSLDCRLEELGSFLDSSISLRNSFHESDHYKDELKPTSWRHYRPRNPRIVPASMDNNLGHASTAGEGVRESEKRTSQQDIIHDTQDYRPRAKVRRSFSTQPTSKFTLNSGLSNGVTQNSNNTNPLTPAERDKNNVITNGPTVNNNNSSQLWNGTTNVSANRNTFSTAPMKAVYALNFPLPSTNSNFSNNLLKGSNKHATLTTSRLPRYSSSHRLSLPNTPLSRSNSVDDMLVSPVHQPPAMMVNGAGVKCQDIT